MIIWGRCVWFVVPIVLVYCYWSLVHTDAEPTLYAPGTTQPAHPKKPRAAAQPHRDPASLTTEEGTSSASPRKRGSPSPYAVVHDAWSDMTPGPGHYATVAMHTEMSRVPQPSMTRWNASHLNLTFVLTVDQAAVAHYAAQSLTADDPRQDLPQGESKDPRESARMDKGANAAEGTGEAGATQRDRAVVVTFASQKHIPLLLNWMVWLEVAGVHDVLVFALDAPTRTFLVDHGVPCMLVPVPQLAAIWVVRVALFQALLACNVTFCHSDADALWLRDPRPYMASLRHGLVFSQVPTKGRLGRRFGDGWAQHFFTQRSSGPFPSRARVVFTFLGPILQHSRCQCICIWTLAPAFQCRCPPAAPSPLPLVIGPRQPPQSRLNIGTELVGREHGVHQYKGPNSSKLAEDGLQPTV